MFLGFLITVGIVVGLTLLGAAISRRSPGTSWQGARRYALHRWSRHPLSAQTRIAARLPSSCLVKCVGFSVCGACAPAETSASMKARVLEADTANPPRRSARR